MLVNVLSTSKAVSAAIFVSSRSYLLASNAWESSAPLSAKRRARVELLCPTFSNVLCKLFCAKSMRARCFVQEAPRKLLWASCPVQVAVFKWLCADGSVQESRSVHCARCSVQAYLCKFYLPVSAGIALRLYSKAVILESVLCALLLYDVRARNTTGILSHLPFVPFFSKPSMPLPKRP